MQNATFRTLVVVAILLGGLLVSYASLWGDSGSNQVPGFSYVVDLDYWRRTEREQLVKTDLHFDLAHDLDDVPLQIGEWQGEDVPETNLEVFILLEPEQFVQRLYQDSDGHYLWLTLIGGRNSRSFHPPDLCYDADGWKASLSSQAISLDEGGEIYGLWLEAHKPGVDEAADFEHMVFYFYLFPDSKRDQADGIVLLKLTSPRYGSVEETLAVQGDFLRHLLKNATPVTRGL
jgi:hypothetical protein